MSLSWGKSIERFRQQSEAAAKRVDSEIEEIVDDMGKYLKLHAEKGTPVDTGFAKRSWALSTKGSGQKRQSTVFNTATTAKNPKNRGRRVLAQQYYLDWVENGTIRIAPRRFFKKAIIKTEQYKLRLLSQLGKDLSKDFENGKIT